MSPRRAAIGGAVALALALAGLWAASPRGGPEFRTFRGEAMATTWEVVLPARPAAEGAAAEVFGLFRALDLELSEWKEGSPLTAVNRAAGVAPVAVPPDLLRLVGRGLEIGGETEGAFDITWAALWGLWDFRAAEPRMPTDEEIADRIARVDYRKVVIDGAAGTILLPERGMLIGLGGIAKGYALDRAAEKLAARGFADFLLVAGGQVLARGSHGDRPWRVGIRDPRGAPTDVFARLEIGDASLSTSADNESYFVFEGVRYHHILDPRTGRPSRGLRSATVLHADATLADALSTAVMVLGRERGLAVVRRLGGEALVVDESARVAVTAGLEGRVETLHPPRPE